ncbi:hypothetical protein PRIPAC_74837, partial [Pristionchus pacificus]|uniref:Uncharacterized protein n=1 Tax=Pristionchus pacificus TaxID=54126 RepID=A0A2A6C0C5_PRIPA
MGNCSSTAEERLDKLTAALSPLEKLPLELAWAIIDHASEAVRKLRQVSRLFRHHVDKRVLGRPKIQLVQTVEFDGGFHADFVDACLTVPERYAALVELRFKLLHSDLPPGPLGLYRIHRVKDDEQAVYILKIDLKRAEVWAKVIDVIGNRTAELSLLNCPARTVEDALNKFMIDFRFDKINVKTSCVDADVSARLFDSQRKYIMFHFLLELASHVETMTIGQVSKSGIQMDSNYFLGWHDFQWEPTIIEMLSRKLRYRLTGLGKKVWFDASCDVHENETSFMQNNHVVRVGPKRIFIDENGLAQSMGESQVSPRHPQPEIHLVVLENADKSSLAILIAYAITSKSLENMLVEKSRTPNCQHYCEKPVFDRIR